MLREIISSALVSLSAIFFIVDPLAVVPVYLAITAGDTEEQKRDTALRAALTSGLTLIVFAAAGGLIFKMFGISLPAFKIAGGMLCFLVALDMMQARPSRTRSTPEEEQEGVEKADVAIIPLAIPLLSGPGAIATVMVITAKSKGGIEYAMVFAAIGITSIATWLVLRGAGWIERRLSKTLLNVLMRVMGLILAAIAVEFVLNGIHEAFPKV
ncbi:MAG: MarC family protein [Polyangia bacterium]